MLQLELPTVSKTKLKQSVEECQGNIQQVVENRKMSAFGERLKEAFETNKIGEIARKMDVSYQAAKNYIEGRIPDADKLKEISDSTNCSIHWLITGKGNKELTDTKVVGLINEDNLKQVIREVVQEEISNGIQLQHKIQAIVMAMKTNIKEQDIFDNGNDKAA